MQVSNTVAGPPVHAGRGGGRPAAAAPPAETQTQGRPTAVAPAEGDEPTKRGGSQTPFTHALKQGNGNKTGIHRRLEAAQAAEQYQTELGLKPPAAESDGEVTDAPAVEAPPDPEGEASAPDGDAGDVPVDQAPVDHGPGDEDAVLEAPVVDPDAGEHAAPEAPAAEPPVVETELVDPIATGLLDALEEAIAASNEPEPA